MTPQEIAELATESKKSIYARAQDAGHSLEAMQAHRSSHGYWYNEETEEEYEVLLDGICAIEIGNKGFGGSCADEVVIFYGRHIQNVYDGEVVFPTEIIARVTRVQYAEILERMS
jgi:hypothetical protein